MDLRGQCLCGRVRWRFLGAFESVTACNCSACRRYGTLWAYDYEGEAIVVAGETRAYQREKAVLGFHFCPDCGCVGYWRSLYLDADGRRRIAVNVRLIDDPEPVMHLAIDHFDGHDTFDDLPHDGRTVRQMWF